MAHIVVRPLQYQAMPMLYIYISPSTVRTRLFYLYIPKRLSLVFLVYVVPTHMVCLSQTYRSGFAFPLQASNCLGIEFWLVDETEKAYIYMGNIHHLIYLRLIILLIYF